MAVIKWARAASYNKANTYPGANGEIVIDIEQNRLFLYDGANAYVSNTFFQSNVYTPPVYVPVTWAVSNSDPYISWQILGGSQTIFAIPANSDPGGTWKYDLNYTSASGGNAFGTGGSFVTVTEGISWNGQTYNGYYQSSGWGTGNGTYEIWHTSVSSPAWTNEANASANAVFEP